ncbi:hypothetical protein EDB83DRAFT_2434516 [Lactarius deliciosus]|nr:hypothetical protein EDB83DRAFT_2434516 [Lactarius deliciosus]
MYHVTCEPFCRHHDTSADSTRTPYINTKNIISSSSDNLAMDAIDVLGDCHAQSHVGRVMSSRPEPPWGHYVEIPRRSQAMCVSPVLAVRLRSKNSTIEKLPHYGLIFWAPPASLTGETDTVTTRKMSQCRRISTAAHASGSSHPNAHMALPISYFVCATRNSSAEFDHKIRASAVRSRSSALRSAEEYNTCYVSAGWHILLKHIGLPVAHQTLSEMTGGSEKKRT